MRIIAFFLFSCNGWRWTFLVNFRTISNDFLAGKGVAQKGGQLSVLSTVLQSKAGIYVENTIVIITVSDEPAALQQHA